MTKQTIKGKVVSIDKLQISMVDYSLLVRVEDVSRCFYLEDDIHIRKIYDCVISTAFCNYVEKYMDKEKHSFQPAVVPTLKSSQVDRHSELVSDLIVYLKRKNQTYTNNVLDYVEIIGEEITDEKSERVFIMAENVVLYNSDNELLPDLTTGKNN